MVSFAASYPTGNALAWFLTRRHADEEFENWQLLKAAIAIVFGPTYVEEEAHLRHVARVLERGVTFCRVWGSYPRKILNSSWRIPQNLMIFFNCQRNFGCPNIFCS